MESYAARSKRPGLELQCFNLLWVLLLVATFFFPGHIWAQSDNARGNSQDKAQAKFDQGLKRIRNIIVIYQENWSFDGLYGTFPGANGISNASATSLTQNDRIAPGGPLSGETTLNPAFTYDPATLQNPPPGLDSSNKIDTRFLTNPLVLGSPTKVNTLLPYDLSQVLPSSSKTGDIVHRFWQEQSQIDGGKQDRYITWSDNPGLVMSHFDASILPEGMIAKQYTMDDNFFHSAFGGSFLNHQFLISARAPVFPNAAVLTPSSLPVLDATGNQLALAVTGKISGDGKITPINAIYDNYYAVNTIFSKNLVPTFKKTTDSDLLPSQNDSDLIDPKRVYIPTIGDRLDEEDVSWKWYSGGWDAALASSPSNPHPVTPATVDPNFQWHHQPLAYYDRYAPWLPDGQRNPMSVAHLQDESNFTQDLQNGILPAVSFIKPIGANNEHPGYTDLQTGQQHVADIVRAVQNSDYADKSIIVITYDENGGRWDHVAPPVIDQWGPGTRVPAIVIGKWVKRGYVDHTQYDTSSILSLIEHRFDLKPLTSRDANAMPLINAFDFHDNDRNEDEGKGRDKN